MQKVLVGIRWAALFTGLLCALWSDCKRNKIPNRLNICMAAVGMGLALCCGRTALFDALSGFFLGLLLGIVLWLLRVFRAGDAKLVAALGAMMGRRWLVNELAWALLVGAVLGLLILIRKRELRPRLRRIRDFFRGIILSGKVKRYEPPENAEGELPFAVPLFLGAVLTLLCQPL